jgi:hypothetical protein
MSNSTQEDASAVPAGLPRRTEDGPAKLRMKADAAQRAAIAAELQAALDGPFAASRAAARDLITDGTATVLITNAQAQSPAASQLSQAAEDKGLDKKHAVINVNETPDNGQSYFDYLDNTVSALEKATGSTDGDAAK